MLWENVLAGVKAKNAPMSNRRGTLYDYWNWERLEFSLNSTTLRGGIGVSLREDDARSCIFAI